MTLLMTFYFLFAFEGLRWWDYPGLELWKFVNLAIFVAGLVFVLVRKANLGAAFRARGETIKAELEKARTERDAALAKLKEIEERLAGLDSQTAAIKERGRIEAR